MGGCKRVPCHTTCGLNREVWHHSQRSELPVCSQSSERNLVDQPVPSGSFAYFHDLQSRRKVWRLPMDAIEERSDQKVDLHECLRIKTPSATVWTVLWDPSINEGHKGPMRAVSVESHHVLGRAAAVGSCCCCE